MHGSLSHDHEPKNGAHSRWITVWFLAINSSDAGSGSLARNGTTSRWVTVGKNIDCLAVNASAGR